MAEPGRCLENPDRTQAEDEEMLHAAHASLYHWLQVGTVLHHQRGLWMIARVHAVLGHAAEALRYASRCWNSPNSIGT